MHSHSEIAQTLIAVATLPPAPINPPRWQIAVTSWPVAILALMMFLMPTLGVPSELMLQDTLKSALVAFGVLIAALVFFGQQRQLESDPNFHQAFLLEKYDDFQSQ